MAISSHIFTIRSTLTPRTFTASSIFLFQSIHSAHTFSTSSRLMHLGSLAMDSLIDPSNMAAMRVSPVIPIKLHEFNLQVHPASEATLCHFHYTPALASEPTPPPSPPRLGEKEDNPEQNTNVTIVDSNIVKGNVALAVSNNELQSVDISALPAPEFINTHGRNSGLGSASIVAFSQGFARIRPVLSFENKSDCLNERAATFRALLNAYPSVDVLGGRSKGARAAARAQLYTSAKTLVFFTYPLTRGMDIRSEELLALEADCDVLFIVGDEDVQCIEILLHGIREQMRAKTWRVRVVNADHKMAFAKPEMRDEICGVAGQIAALWTLERARDRTELTLKWDYDAGQTTWTPWVAFGEQEPPKEIRYR